MAVTIRPSTEGIALPKLKGAANIAAWHGLSGDEARHRLTLGPNAIADVSQQPVQRALGKLWAPVPWMLEAAILLQLFLGDYVEAAVVAFLLVANGAIGFFQKGRAQATLDASNRDWRWSRLCNVTECGPQFPQPRSL
jgi:magnesium-transporting ATPase (P-type)